MSINTRAIGGLVAILAWTAAASAQLCGEWSITANPMFEGEQVYPIFFVPFAPDHAIGLNDIQPQSGQRGLLRAEWDGSAWTVLSVDPIGLDMAWDLRATAGSAPDDLWGAGLVALDNFNGRPFLTHFDGQGWDTVVATMPDDPNPQGGDPVRSGEGSALAVISPEDIWVIGTGDDLEKTVSSPIACHFDGSNLDEVGPLQPVYNRINQAQAASASGTDDVWIVGYGRNTGESFHMFTYHWDGSGWSPVSTWTPLPGQDVVQELLEDVVVFAPNDAWAVGKKLVLEDGTTHSASLYLHWDGSSWAEVQGPDIGPLGSVTASGPNDIWTTCPFGEYGGRLAHYDGTAWTEFDSAPVPEQATHIGLTWLTAGPTCDDVWMLGYWAVYDGAGGWSEYHNILEHFAPVQATCPADTNGDGMVDVDDLTNVILDWGTNGSGHGGNINGSVMVDVDDLTMIILAWGPC